MREFEKDLKEDEDVIVNDLVEMAYEASAEDCKTILRAVLLIRHKEWEEE